MGAGTIQAAAVVIVAMVSIFVPVHILVRIERLVGVVRMTDPSWDGTWRYEHFSGGLVGVALGIVIVEQVTCSVDHAE